MGISIEVVQTILLALIAGSCIGILIGLYWIAERIQFAAENEEEE